MGFTDFLNSIQFGQPRQGIGGGLRVRDTQRSSLPTDHPYYEDQILSPYGFLVDRPVPSRSPEEFPLPIQEPLNVFQAPIPNPIPNPSPSQIDNIGRLIPLPSPAVQPAVQPTTPAKFTTEGGPVSDKIPVPRRNTSLSNGYLQAAIEKRNAEAGNYPIPKRIDQAAHLRALKDIGDVLGSKTHMYLGIGLTPEQQRANANQAYKLANTIRDIEQTRFSNDLARRQAARADIADDLAFYKATKPVYQDVTSLDDYGNQVTRRVQVGGTPTSGTSAGDIIGGRGTVTKYKQYEDALGNKYHIMPDGTKRIITRAHYNKGLTPEQNIKLQEGRVITKHGFLRGLGDWDSTYDSNTKSDAGLKDDSLFSTNPRLSEEVDRTHSEVNGLISQYGSIIHLNDPDSIAMIHPSDVPAIVKLNQEILNTPNPFNDWKPFTIDYVLRSPQGQYEYALASNGVALNKDPEIHSLEHVGFAYMRDKALEQPDGGDDTGHLYGGWTSEIGPGVTPEHRKEFERRGAIDDSKSYEQEIDPNFIDPHHLGKTQDQILSEQPPHWKTGVYNPASVTGLSSLPLNLR